MTSRRAAFFAACLYLASAGLAPADDDRSGLPDPQLTPGAVRPLTPHAICATRWGEDPRAVTEAMKHDVFAAYGFTGNDDPRCRSTRENRRCEIDHLVPRSLGGADVTANLWPQAYAVGKWNATRKDRLEHRMHAAACRLRPELRAGFVAEAQHGFMTDWRALYLRVYTDR